MVALAWMSSGGGDANFKERRKKADGAFGLSFLFYSIVPRNTKAEDAG